MTSRNPFDLDSDSDDNADTAHVSTTKADTHTPPHTRNEVTATTPLAHRARHADAGTVQPPPEGTKTHQDAVPTALTVQRVARHMRADSQTTRPPSLAPTTVMSTQNEASAAHDPQRGTHASTVSVPSPTLASRSEIPHATSPPSNGRCVVEYDADTFDETDLPMAVPVHRVLNPAPTRARHTTRDGANRTAKNTPHHRASGKDDGKGQKKVQQPSTTKRKLKGWTCERCGVKGTKGLKHKCKIPPSNYVCHICNQPGHWIQDCEQRKQQCATCNRHYRGATHCPHCNADTDNADGTEGTMETQNAATRKRRQQQPASPAVQRPACKFWARGSCKSGADCKFKHEPHTDLALVVCRFHRASSCLKGDACLYSHDLKLLPCRFFHSDTGSTCPQGNACRFSHDALTDAQRDFLDAWNNSQQHPPTPPANPLPHDTVTDPPTVPWFAPDEVVSVRMVSSAAASTLGVDGDGGVFIPPPPPVSASPLATVPSRTPPSHTAPFDKAQRDVKRPRLDSVPQDSDVNVEDHFRGIDPTASCFS
eukprot:m.28327 g.28327  ORF g.28327 m.28327 type:complete len:537 (-) comp4509_c0_seq1:139-1749(-)